LAPQPNNSDPFFDAQSAPKKQAAESIDYTSESLWLAAETWFGDLLVTPGVRAFHYSQVKRTDADPRLNLRYQLTTDHALKAAVGQYSETPQFQDTDATFGNPNLKYIRSFHYILGVETNWSDLWLSDIQAFYKVIDHVVESDAVHNVSNSGSAISTGLEVFVRRNLTERLFGWLAYTYSRNLAREDSLMRYHHSQYDQTQVLNLAGNYKLSALWDLGGRAVARTGNTYTGVDHSVYNVDLDKYQPRQGVNAPLYNKREPPYYELDLYADRDVLYDTWKLTWRFGIEYLALKPQVQGVQYNYDYSELKYFRGVPPIPYLEVRGVL
jgi:outer membrane receptor protein involved in Fe transport